MLRPTDTEEIRAAVKRLGEGSKALLLDPHASVRSFTLAFDTLVEFGLVSPEGEFTETERVAKEIAISLDAA